MSGAALEPLIARLEAVTRSLEQHQLSASSSNGNGQHNAAADDGPVALFVSEFDNIISGPLAEFVGHGHQIGGDVATHVAMVQRAFSAQRAFILLASRASKPSDAVISTLLKPQVDIITEITEFREKNRRSKFFNHLSTLSESIAALSWVVTSPAPAPLVKEMNDAGQFWGNRVIKENKAHQTFTRAWSETLSALQSYVKQHHTTGLSWNPRGGDATKLSAAISGGGGVVAPSAAGGAPPPPPPKLPPAQTAAQLLGTAAAAGGGGGSESNQRAALFSEINRGESVTSGLRRVTKDMQTHKNPALRDQGPVKPRATAAKPVVTATAAGGATVDKPAVCELRGKKWVVEHQRARRDLTLSDTAMNQTVYVYRCQDSVLQVKGKVNSIIVDSCRKTALVLDSVVASVEFVNCVSCQVQVTGVVPTISIDKTDGLQMYLSKDSLDVVLVTSKSSEMNVLIPKSDGDYTEMPVAEQFKTVISAGKLVTTVNESA